jgi:hypothetical protein
MKLSTLAFCVLAAPTLAFCQTGQATSPDSSPAFSPAAELNNVLPYWLTFGGQYRARFEGYTGGGYSPNATDAYMLSQLQLNLSIHPVSWFKIFAQGMDARVFAKSPALPPYQNTWDIRQAYVEIGDPENKIFGLRVGRQELNFGDQRLIGASPWTNVGRVFDAVRGTIRYDGYRLDMFASSVVNPVTGTWDHHLQGNNLHGLYGGIEKLIPNATLEPYVLWRLQPRVKNEAGVVANMDEKVLGTRLIGKLPAGFDYGTEMVREFGSVGSDQIKAWAGHWVVGDTFNAVKFTPRVFAEFNYASGDKNPKDGARGTFDQLYPSGHDKYGLADQVGWRNIKDARAGVEAKLVRNLAATVEYNNWYLASATDSLYVAAGTAAFRSITGAAGTHVGQEIDITGTWTIIKPLVAGAGFGHIIPGEFLKKTTPGNPYNYPYMMFIWKF